MQDDSSPFGGAPGVDPPPGDAPTTRSASSCGRDCTAARGGVMKSSRDGGWPTAPAAQVWALYTAAAGRSSPSPRQPGTVHAGRIPTAPSARPPPVPPVGHSPGLAAASAASSAASAASSRAWVSSPPSPGPPTQPPCSIEVHHPAHCSTVTYLLTTHSTEVAVDEAMYLVETSEAVFIGGDREEAAV